jgi:hypothetical protein
VTVAIVRKGEPHPLGWVPTVLKTDDELGTFPGHVVPRARNLAELYDLSARAIVEGNGYAFTSDAIEGDGGWIHDLHAAGLGGRLVNGKWHFTGGTVIFLPPGGPRRPAIVVAPERASRAGVALALLFGVPVVATAAAVLFRKLKRKG